MQSQTERRWTGKKSSLERLVKIYNAISSGSGSTVASMAEDLEVSTRTVERDLEFMRDRLGAPLKYDRGKRTHVLAEPWGFPTVTMTEGEAIVLYLGENLLQQCTGTAYEGYIRSCMDKIRTILQNDVHLRADELHRLVSFRLPQLRGDQKMVADHYTTILGAVNKRFVVSLTYKALSTGKTSERNVEPYHITVKEGACYLLAFCRLRREYRLFALDRIERAEVTNEEYTVDKDFDPGRFLERSWSLEKGETHIVRLRFDSVQAPYIKERTWHESQEIESLDDGGIIFNVMVEGLGEITRWAMQFGSHAEVIEPPELREAVREEVRKLSNLYGFR